MIRDPDGAPAASGAEPSARHAAARALATVTAAYDFPTPANPAVFYVVASTPRSGSTYLCRQLWATGLMGAPLEYFNYQGVMLQMVARLEPTNLLAYVRGLFALRTSPNGVFGFKAHWDQFELVVNGRLLPLFPGLRFIHIERRDRLAQAVSFARAEQSGQWVARGGPRPVPVYDRRQVRSCLRRLERQTAQWKALFAGNGLEPIRVTYESLTADPQSVCDGILGRFGIVRDPVRALGMHLPRRQSDSVNREWIERYRSESAEAASAGGTAARRRPP